MALVENIKIDAVTPLTDVSALSGAAGTSAVYLNSYRPGGSVGGGVFVWEASRLKSEHDGVVIFSPTVPYNLNASTYCAGTGETDSSGSGCFVRALESATHISTDMAGLSDGSGPNSTAAHAVAFQKVLNACARLGKHVQLGYGAIHIEAAVSMPAFADNAGSMPRIEGYGINSSYLICYPLGTDTYSITCMLNGFTQTWGMKDFQVREKGGTRTGYLMKLGRITGAVFKRIKWFGGYQQLLAQSVLSCTWIEPAWAGGYRGAKFEAGGTIGAGTYANPNANYLLRPQILSMQNQGLWVVGATQFRIQAGSMEGCGAPGDTSFRGVYMQGGGSDGTQGLIADSMYIETCSGYPFYLATGGNRSIKHTIKDCNFNNNSAQYPASQVIMLGSNFAFPTGVVSTLEFIGNTCLGVGYTGSGSRPDVYVDQFSSQGQAQLVQYGNRFIPSQPPVVQNTVRIRNSGNAGASGQISGGGAVTNARNILTAAWGSAGACTLTFNHDVSAHQITATVLGTQGYAIVGSVSAGTVVVRTYGSTGAAASLDFYLNTVDTRDQFSAS